MLKSKILRYGVIAVASLSLAGGVALASSDSIDNTGPDSWNTITHNNKATLDIDNHNDVDVNNNNDQDASTGDATVKHNTTGGDATTGDASAENDTNTDVTLSNNSCSCWSGLWGGFGGNDGSISNTGPDSHNKITFKDSLKVDIDNHNDVDVNNNNDQDVSSGNAKVEGNTTGGDATSGDATASNHTSTTVDISN